MWKSIGHFLVVCLVIVGVYFFRVQVVTIFNFTMDIVGNIIGAIAGYSVAP